MDAPQAKSTAPKAPVKEDSSEEDFGASGGHSEPGSIEKPGQPFDFGQFQAVLQALKLVRRPLTVAPSIPPKNFMEQIQYYDSGGVQRLYIYISGTWRYVALT